jgi:hypothetical protein
MFIVSVLSEPMYRTYSVDAAGKFTVFLESYVCMWIMFHMFIIPRCMRFRRGRSSRDVSVHVKDSVHADVLAWHITGASGSALVDIMVEDMSFFYPEGFVDRSRMFSRGSAYVNVFHESGVSRHVKFRQGYVAVGECSGRCRCPCDKSRFPIRPDRGSTLFPTNKRSLRCIWSRRRLCWFRRPRFRIYCYLFPMVCLWHTKCRWRIELR